jgi:hypothetical protein
VQAQRNSIKEIMEINHNLIRNSFKNLIFDTMKNLKLKINSRKHQFMNPYTSITSEYLGCRAVVRNFTGVQRG